MNEMEHHNSFLLKEHYFNLLFSFTKNITNDYTNTFIFVITSNNGFNNLYSKVSKQQIFVMREIFNKDFNLYQIHQSTELIPSLNESFRHNISIFQCLTIQRNLAYFDEIRSYFIDDKYIDTENVLQLYKIRIHGIGFLST